MSGTRLDPIVLDVRRRAAERRVKQPMERLKELVREDSWRRERFLSAFRPGSFSILAEMKRRSPSFGTLLADVEDQGSTFSTLPTRLARPGPRWFSLAQAYQKGGAAALSVVTEEDHFHGSLDDLRAVEFTRLPRLRKDFILDEGMLYESCLYGADAVLLLPVILEDGPLTALRNLARVLGLAVLVEVHDERELERVLPLEPELLGVNARDLKTFRVDLSTVERLMPRVPPGPVKVAESGITDLEDLKRVRAAGADAALVGETLIRSPDPESALRSWREALEP